MGKGFPGDVHVQLVKSQKKRGGAPKLVVLFVVCVCVCAFGV